MALPALSTRAVGCGFVALCLTPLTSGGSLALYAGALWVRHRLKTTNQPWQFGTKPEQEDDGTYELPKQELPAWARGRWPSSAGVPWEPQHHIGPRGGRYYQRFARSGHRYRHYF